jgi:hypothetical protein
MCTAWARTLSTPDSLDSSAEASALAGMRTRIQGCPPISSCRSLQWLPTCNSRRWQLRPCSFTGQQPQLRYRELSR